MTARVPSRSGENSSVTSIFDLGLVVVVSLMSLIGADPPAADLDVVVLDELARGLEPQAVLSRSATAEHHDRHEDDREQQHASAIPRAAVNVDSSYGGGGTGGGPVLVLLPTEHRRRMFILR
jgi:hypothetical protein